MILVWGKGGKGDTWELKGLVEDSVTRFWMCNYPRIFVANDSIACMDFRDKIK